jgi:hypothetical protein
MARVSDEVTVGVVVLSHVAEWKQCADGCPARGPFSSCMILTGGRGFPVQCCEGSCPIWHFLKTCHQSAAKLVADKIEG